MAGARASSKLKAWFAISGLVCLSMASPPARAFNFFAHWDITDQGLLGLSYQYKDHALSFDPNARGLIFEKVITRDPATLFGLLGFERYHCDADMIAECVNLVADEFETLIAYLIARSNDEPSSLLLSDEHQYQLFADMLHTVQDFYSHANWVELGYRYVDFGEPLGIGPITAFDLSSLGGSLAPCPSNDGTTIDADEPGRSRLGSGHYVRGKDASDAIAKGLCLHGPVTLGNKDYAGISKDGLDRANFSLAYTRAIRATTMLAMKVLERLENAGEYRAMCVFLQEPTSKCEGSTASGTFSASGSSYIGYVGGCTAPMKWAGTVSITELDTSAPKLVFTGDRTFGPDCLPQVDRMGPWPFTLTRTGSRLTGSDSSSADTLSWDLTISSDRRSITGTFTDQHNYFCCGSYASGSASGSASLTVDDP